MLKMLKLAARNMRRNMRRTAISLVSLVLGVTLMVVMRGFLNGQRAATVQLLVGGGAGMMQVHRQGYLDNVQGLPLTFDMVDSPELRLKIKQVHGVLAVAPRITFGAMVSVPDEITPGHEAQPDEQGRTAYISATAIDPELEKQVTPQRWDWLADGRIFSGADADEVVLNAALNKGLAAPIMAELKDHPPVERWPAIMAGDRDGSMNGANVRLVGTLNQALPGDKRNGLVALSMAQKLLRMPDRVTEYALSVDAHALDQEKLEQIRDALQAALGSEYEVSTWLDILPVMKDGLRTQEYFFGIMIGTFMFIALLGIVNTMLMSVLERVREIGTMLAVGTTRGQIMEIFIFEGLLQGWVGAWIGGSIGYALVVFMGSNGVTIPAPGSALKFHLFPFIGVGFVFFAVIFATVCSALAALYPAYRAGKLRPVEALAST